MNWGSDSSKTLVSPHGIAVNNTTNEIYVSEETANCIKKFDKDGRLLLQWGSYFDVNNHEIRLDDAIHQGHGQFNHPIGLAIDSNGNVYVADQRDDRIQKFDSNGKFLGKWGSYGSVDGYFNRPHGIAVGRDDEVYVCDSLNYRVQKFTPNGIFKSQWGARSTKKGKFDFPRFIALSRDMIFVTESSTHRVQVFAPAWTGINLNDYEDLMAGFN